MYEVEVLCRAEAWVKADMNLLMSCLQVSQEPPPAILDLSFAAGLIVT